MRSAAAACFAFALVAQPAAVHAQATADKAQELQAAFERFLGKPSDGSKGWVSVAPAGDSYELSLDIARMAEPLKPFLQIGPVVYKTTLTPATGGLWQVTSGNLPPLDLAVKDQKISMQFNNMKFTGTYDPRLMSFIIGRTTMDGMTMRSTAQGFENNRQDGPSSVLFTAAGPNARQVSLTFKAAGGQHQQTFIVDPSAKRGAKPGQAGKKMTFALSIGSTSQEGSIQRLNNESILKLWAFIVENIGTPKEQMRAKWPQVRAMLQEALPVFERMSQTGTLNNVQVSTPFGAGSMEKVDFGFTMNGLIDEGLFGMRIGFSGLKLPPLPIPPQFQGFIPDEVVVDAKVSGYNLNAPAREILAKIRPGMPKSETNAIMQKAALMISPDMSAKVDIGPSKFISKMLQVHFEGSMVVKKPLPTGSVKVRAKGLDETIKTLQPMAASDKKLQQALIGLIAAKGFGKALPDGSLEWNISLNGSGKASINGFEIPIPLGRGRR